MGTWHLATNPKAQNLRSVLPRLPRNEKASVRLASSVALDEATAAHRAQPRAQRLCCVASIRRDANAMPDRRFAHGRAHEERLTAAENRLIFLLELRVSGKRAALQTIADELHAALGAGGVLGAAGTGFAASFVVPTHGVSLATLTCQVRASGRFHSSAE